MRRAWILILVALFIVGCGGEQADPTATNEPAATEAAVDTQPTTEAGELADPEARGQALVEYFVAGEWEAAVETFDSSVAGALPATKLEETWTGLQEQFGTYQSIVSTRLEERDGLQIVFVTTEFANDNLDVQIAYDQTGTVKGLFFRPVSTSAAPTQVSSDDDAFEETVVQFGDPEWQLNGVLTLPKGDGPFPAVVLVHGSGPNDRDSTVGPNKPFRDIAWGLASNGVAVLRYDKRTLTYGMQMQDLAITVQDETVDDAVAAANFLREQAAIDSEHVFILGHSFGGMLIPRIAEQDEASAGFIILGGSTIPIEEKILQQSIYLAELDDVVQAEEQTQLDLLEEQVNTIKSPELDVTTPLSETLGVPASYWLDLRTYNPAQQAQDIERPLLILQGERDYQVTMEDFAGWQAALEDRPNVEFKQYPKLNHLFMAGEGPATPNEYQTPNRVEPQVILDIIDWIKQQV